MKFIFKVEIFQKLCWYSINLNTSWIPCRKNFKLIFLHSVFIYGTCHILNLGVQIHIIYINPFESFLLNLTMNMHGQYFVITLKKTKMPIIDQSLWRTNQNPITSFWLTFWNWKIIISCAYLQVQTQQLTLVKGYTSPKRNCVDVLVLLPVNMLFQVPSIGKMKRKINPKNR